MNILIILAHPNINSFNHAISHSVISKLKENGHDIILHDLYAEKFNPLLPYEEFSKDSVIDINLKKHCDELISADGIIFVHPNWWGQPPAILKGWIDRVIRPGIAYEFEEEDNGEGIPQGLLEGKICLVFNTSNTSTSRENNFFGDPLDLIWKKCIFEFCGIKKYYRKMYNIIVSSTPEDRIKWLYEIENTVSEYFPYTFSKKEE